MKVIRRFLGRRASAEVVTSHSTSTEPPAPERDVYVVGDIHGRLDLLERLLEAIDADLTKRAIEDPQLVFVGDYIDRGDQSAEVLRRLRELEMAHCDNVVCLMGNHERMMLDFIDNPPRYGPRWLRNGGLQTLASFSVSAAGVGETVAPEVFINLSDELRDRIGKNLEAWVRHQPLVWNSGTLWVVHAGVDPATPMPDQNAKALLWGHGDFFKSGRADGQWVAHGHTIMDHPLADNHRISVDTGAVYTSRLTAALIRQNGSVSFIST
ncbi:serine/threonine protein phosphatase [Roseobacter sp. HKCCD9010]|nr:serine/threonine protein phosphatase [Rhodobacterales bacterium HKCCD4356]NNV10798.1 serine/threonine protein phosphatase [Roseobacter sp. HKCCD7357]NNV14983.1 serine/threonine protein phosphatase [Roseobacter sp. HKCCD8768]NNV24442.1 serine/threonine protein phosphatase [Roseobacter sp. HKCCD8192]NNV28699.1 serine/threonine protein phosphatase [Roseobacter sp. HKCCD9061]NNV32972.1 serine/threonine protein phosphatase [Roseobacter sp. HKCCD9073]NNV37223.1 serine/threonine protein phosphata